MANIHEAIFLLNPNVVSICDDTAYDKNGEIVEYDLVAAQNKLVELDAEQLIKEQAVVNAKASALSKLSALGLTQDEIIALLG
jgi:hypothetical protein